MAQGIFFHTPSQIYSGLGSNAIGMAVQDQKAYLAWQQEGVSSEVQIRLYDLITKVKQTVSVTGQFASRPILCSAGKKMYLFWNDQNENIQYLVVTGGQIEKPVVLARSESFRLLSATNIYGHMMLCVVNSNQRNMSVLDLEENSDHTLSINRRFDISKSKNIEYCSAVPGVGSSIRIFWKEQKNRNVMSVSLNLDDSAVVNPLKNTISTEVFRIAGILPLNDPDNQLLVWRRNDKDDEWYYGIMTKGVLHDEYALLPYFKNTTEVPVVAKDDNGNFYIGASMPNKQFMLGLFETYNPAHWIKDFLLPKKGNYTLKDIVIPGSHDAGMSVLTAAGGKNLSIINECNTLTQIQNIKGQLHSGIRMFDMRLDVYKGELYTKHAPSDCMEDAVAGGYGEKLSSVLQSVKQFLKENDKEFVILSFCHFCDKHISIAQQADSIVHGLGKDLLFESKGKNLKDITLSNLSGKVLLTFENYSFPDKNILLNTLGKQSDAPINYKRAYAASNDLNKLLYTQESFFTALKDSVHNNDIVRLDWQLTEAGQEAAFICNEFQSPKSNPLVDGAKFLLNSVKKNKSIIDLARIGNMVLIQNINKWISKGLINKASFPNILYVDVSGNWITDYCIQLNNDQMYNGNK